MKVENERLVRSVYESFSRGDMAAAFANFDPGIVIHEADSLPYAGTYEGDDGMQRLLGTIAQTWKGFELSIDDVTAGDEGRVYALITMRGRLGADAELTTMKAVEVWMVRDGKLVEVRPYYWDTGKVARATQAAR